MKEIFGNVEVENLNLGTFLLLYLQKKGEVNMRRIIKTLF